MATEWFRRAFGAAVDEIKLMRQEREWARLDAMVGKVEAQVERLTAPGHFPTTRMHWLPGKLVWDGERPPVGLGHIEHAQTAPNHDRERGMER